MIKDGDIKAVSEDDRRRCRDLERPGGCCANADSEIDEKLRAHATMPNVAVPTSARATCLLCA